MKKNFVVAALGAMMSTAAVAQTPAPPAATPQNPAATNPAANPAATTTAPSAATSATAVKLTDAEAKAWVDKVIYSSDGKNVGEVAAIARDSNGNVTELHADVGGFLGLGETRVRLMPSDFRLGSDRVTLNMASDQIKTLPHMPK